MVLSCDHKNLLLQKRNVKPNKKKVWLKIMATHTYFLRHLRMSHNSRSNGYFSRKKKKSTDCKYLPSFLIPQTRIYFPTDSKLPLRFELLFKHTRIRSVTRRRRTSMRCGALFVETQQRGACQAESETKAKKRQTGRGKAEQGKATQSREVEFKSVSD